MKITIEKENIELLYNLPENTTELCCSFLGLKTLPELPKNLKNLECSFNKLSELPELPDSLESLDCSDNQLILLPILPDSLKYLTYHHNKLKYKIEPYCNRLVYSRKHQIDVIKINKLTQKYLRYKKLKRLNIF